MTALRKSPSAIVIILRIVIERPDACNPLSDVSPSLPATNAKRLRKGAQATKQSTSPQAAKWIASLRSQ
jgi:hypothetical protein